jgi:ATP/maltotriose-dependent transcriptional regulator MalT
MKEKNIRNEDCAVSLTIKETAKNIADQREQDKIYNPLIDISNADLVKKNFPDSIEFKELNLTEGELYLLPYFCAFLTNKDIVGIIKKEIDNVKRIRTSVYRKFKVSTKYGLHQKAKELGLLEEPCPVCAKKKLKKK